MRRDLLFSIMGLALAPEPTRNRVARCQPAVDEQSQRDATAVCSVCGRRLTLDDIGGGAPDGPYKPLPECKGAPHVP